MSSISYLTDHYDGQIAKINAFGAPLNFIFITDEHNRINEFGNPINAVKSMQYIIDRCSGISFVVTGGDHGNDYRNDTDVLRNSQTELMQALYSLSVPVYACVGNHDDCLGNMKDHGWDTKKCILPDEMHSICMKYNPTNENYYYIDDDRNGYRYVFLNTSDIPYLTDKDGQYPLGWRLEVSDRQAVWLDDEALETDKKVILFSHAPLYNPAIFGTEGMPVAVKPYDDLLGGQRVRYIVNKHTNIVAQFAGHVHFDNLIYDNGVLSVTTLCAMYQQWSPNCPERVTGEYTETAFDVVSIKDNIVKLTRFGAGDDRCGMLLRV